MPTTPDATQYDLLIEFELAAAAAAVTQHEQRYHLDQAAIYAALGEKVRGYALGSTQK